MKFRIIASLLLVVLLAVPMAMGQISPDKFERRVSGGESFTIHFAIFNDHNTTLFFYVKTPDMVDWKIICTPESGVIKPGQAQEVGVEFTAPRASNRELWEISILVELYDSSGLVETHSVNVEVHFETKPLSSLYFGLPFPEEWGHWGTFLDAFLFWVVIGLLVYFILKILKVAVKLTKTHVDDILLDILRTPLTIWIVVYGIYSSILLLPLSNDVFEKIYMLYNVISVLLITWIIYRIYRDLIIHYAFQFRKKLGRMEGALISALDKIGVAAILALGGIMVLQALGIDVTVLLASMGVLGIILGFAAQDTMANFFAGIHILLDRSIEIGDYIILEGDEKVYRVKDVGLRSTKLYDIFANTVSYIPNTIIANHKIINLSRPDTKLKVRIEVGVSYGSDIDLVKRTLMEVAMENPHVLKDDKHRPSVVFSEFGESSLNFTLYVWVDNLVDQWIVMSNIREQIVNKFRERGIEIPFPQVDVHIRR